MKSETNQRSWSQGTPVEVSLSWSKMEGRGGGRAVVAVAILLFGPSERLWQSQPRRRFVWIRIWMTQKDRAISPRNARSVAGCRARGHRSFVCANHDTTKDDIGNINNINSKVPHQPTKLDHRVRNDGVGMSENPAPDNSAENACDNTMDLGSRDV